MELRRYFLVGVGSIVALNLLLAFGAIGLLNRMSPAILEILEENVVSISAVETMLAVLTRRSGGTGIGPEEEHRFLAALSRARENVSEEEEELGVLDEIRLRFRAALNGDSEAVSLVVGRRLRTSENRIDPLSGGVQPRRSNHRQLRRSDRL